MKFKTNFISIDDLYNSSLRFPIWVIRLFKDEPHFVSKKLPGIKFFFRTIVEISLSLFF